jgi:16S rRNA G966 N2-methylase RsmD
MDQFLNKRNSLKALSEDEFNAIVSSLALELEQRGILYDNSTAGEIKKDWISLCKKPSSINISATSTVGMKIMRKHMHHFYEVCNHKGKSVKLLWKKENLEKALRFNRKSHSTPYASEIVRSLSFTNGLGKVTMYRPLMARNVVSYFKAKSVLDVCAGWGGRMLGTTSLGVSYTGIEPCTKTFHGLQAIRDELNLPNVTLMHETAEQAELQTYDLALTSPPYYNLEVYSDEETQSITSKTYKEWINTFLEPVIKKVIACVTYSCWSVKNFKTDKSYDLLTDVIRIHETHGWKQMDITFSMTNSKRPGNAKKTEEITYVFVKNTF